MSGPGKEAILLQPPMHRGGGGRVLRVPLASFPFDALRNTDLASGQGTKPAAAVVGDS